MDERPVSVRSGQGDGRAGSRRVVRLSLRHVPTPEVFIDRKPPGYGLAGERKQMTGAETFATCAPDPEAAPG